MELEMQRENLQQDLEKMMDLLDRQKQEAAEVIKSERENEMKVFELALERDQLQRDVESSNMRLQQTEATLAQEKENYLEKVGLLQDQLHEEQRLSKETTEKLKEVSPSVSFLFIPIPFVIPLSLSFFFLLFLHFFPCPLLFSLPLPFVDREEEQAGAGRGGTQGTLFFLLHFFPCLIPLSSSPPVFLPSHFPSFFLSPFLPSPLSALYSPLPLFLVLFAQLRSGTPI